MRTDPISAAHAYRQALMKIQNARVLHEAYKIAARALDITFDRPTETHISIASGYGHNTQEPFVTFGIANPTESANPIVQLTTDAAREQALFILEAADAADTDGFIIGWLGGTAKLSEGQIAALLNDFRAYREQRRKKGE